MRVKRSILKMIFRQFKKSISKFKKNLSKFKNLLFYNEKEAVKYGEKAMNVDLETNFITVSILEDKSNVFYAVFDENDPHNHRLISYEARMAQYELEKKEELAEVQKEVINTDDVKIDIYEGAKYIVRKTINNIYLKAKELYVPIDGYALMYNKAYNKCIDTYLQVRKDFEDNYIEAVLNNEVLSSFVKDNSINSSNIKDNFEILLKMFIADVHTSLYNGLVKFSKMFNKTSLFANEVE